MERTGVVGKFAPATGITIALGDIIVEKVEWKEKKSTSNRDNLGRALYYIMRKVRGRKKCGRKNVEGKGIKSAEAYIREP